MKCKSTNSPYPVLYPYAEGFAYNQGYKMAHFDVNGDPLITTDATSVKIDFTLDLTDESLKRLVAEGKAGYYVNIECGRTYFRKPYIQDSNAFHIEISNNDLSDSMEIFVGLVAKEDIKGFTSESFEERFGKASFDIEKGDILAAGSGWTVELESGDGNVEPFIQVSKDTNEENADIWVSGAGDKLIVHLAENIYKVYFQNRSKTYKAVLIALVIKPAILSALSEARENEKPIENYRWLRKLDSLIARVMEQSGLEWDFKSVKIFEDRGSDTLNYAVEKLLNKPLLKAMEAIEKTR